MNSSYKKYIVTYIAFILIMLIGVGSFVGYIDPYFHFHGPLNNISYKLSDERYQNDGIARSFEFDGVLVGTSMASNYNKTDIDNIFGTNSVKLTSLGGTNREFRENLQRAFENNNDIKVVLWSIDHQQLLNPADALKYDISAYPTYLYDNNAINDVEYLLNKAAVEDALTDVRRTRADMPSTTFDEYSNFANYATYGEEETRSNYNRQEKKLEKIPFSDEDKKNVQDTVDINFLMLAKEHPDTQFYFFFPPFSILYFDYLNQIGELERYLDAEEYMVNLMLGYENVHIYSFMQEIEDVNNLEMFRDAAHFDQWYNPIILQRIKDGVDEITAENASGYFDFERDYYLNYDYESLFK